MTTTYLIYLLDHRLRWSHPSDNWRATASPTSIETATRVPADKEMIIDYLLGNNRLIGHRLTPALTSYIKRLHIVELD